jgi:N-dimethylarginine dimethylaminohydrolase
MRPVLSEHGQLAAVMIKHARDAFVSESVIASQWRQLNFSAPPDFSRAVEEYDTFIDIVADSGCEIVELPPASGVTLDSIYTRDASVVTAEGVLLARMGKPTRGSEPDAQAGELRRLDWPVAKAIKAPGHLEGGDILWLDPKTLAVGVGARTNMDGILQLKAVLDGSVDEVIVVPLPDYPGQHDVMHLMSLVSPVDRDLAVVYSRLLPSGFRETLVDRGYRFVEVPDEEFDSMGANVLALAPRDCVMLNGNPKTRAALEHAGANVRVYDGVEISLKGGGGPTCLTRPLVRV